MDTPAVTFAKDMVSVFKLRIGVAITISAIGGIAVTPAELPPAWRLATLCLAVFAASASAGAFNQWAEVDLDRQMRRTAKRPFASGRLSAGMPWLVAILTLLTAAVSLAAWSTNGWAAVHTFMGAFVYGIVYTLWLKRRSVGNIVIGGIAGSFAVLAGAAAVDTRLHAEPMVMALVLFLWTPPHFWALAIAGREDYAAAGVPMLPVVAGNRFTAWVILGHTALLVALSLLPAFWSMGWIYLAGAAIGGGYFLWSSVMLVAEPTRRRAIGTFLASLLQLVLLVFGAVADRLIGAI
ncbi:MAG: heme o synthase [Hyphomicrobiales bacterium]